MNKKLLTAACSAVLLLMSAPSQAVNPLPASTKIATGVAEEACPGSVEPEWRKAQVIDGVKIQESQLCQPDNPYDIATFVKGTNNVSMDTLMNTQLAADAITMTDDVDGDGDPDHIFIKLEVAELNGHSPDVAAPMTTFDIAPGIRPTFWVFAPKSRDMSTDNVYSTAANPLLRAPSPTIRVEQGDTVWITLENTHYMPHSIHLHGIDHPYMDHSGEGNDGVGQTSNMDVMPGQSKTYVIKPRQAGTMYYHCHVQPHTHVPMGLQGIFVVEENRPNNWVQTFNVGNGQVRHPSVAVSEKYAREYDLHYQTADKEMHSLASKSNDPRLTAKHLNHDYNITKSSANYFMLNGRSFPYTIRESIIEMQPNEKVKLRVLNASDETVALHLHGHKPTATHYDGVDNGPNSHITRDVHAIATAQRLDLELNGIDDGLHSFGEGVWMFHDHVEKTFTTNGIGEGGGISLVVYKKFLNEKGIPSLHGMDLTPYFTKEFWQGKYPVWQDYDKWQSLGVPATDKVVAAQAAVVAAEIAQKAASAVASTESSSSVSNLFYGIFLGLLSYLLIIKRQSVINLVQSLLKRPS
jgi:FtsP/CotA-like multicopper oxidase with cupredoxin domain